MDNKKVITISARNDLIVGWNADVKDKHGVCLHIGNYVMMLSMASEIAKQVKQEWPGCRYVIESCVTDDTDDCGMLKKIIKMFLERD